MKWVCATLAALTISLVCRVEVFQILSQDNILILKPLTRSSKYNYTDIGLRGQVVVVRIVTANIDKGVKSLKKTKVEEPIFVMSTLSF